MAFCRRSISAIRCAASVFSSRQACITRSLTRRIKPAAVHEFLDRFGRLLSEDARQDFWIRSHGDVATIVPDRHNLICAYGPLDAFESALHDLGVRKGAPPPI